MDIITIAVCIVAAFLGGGAWLSFACGVLVALLFFARGAAALALGG